LSSKDKTKQVCAIDSINLFFGCHKIEKPSCRSNHGLLLNGGFFCIVFYSITVTIENGEKGEIVLLI